MYATFQEDHVGLKLLKELGEDNVLWASDYPHGDSVWPDSHQIVDRDMAGMDQAVVRKLTRDNARKLYLGQ
jgi:predicted TIM-barrel fold metal-dependent hydrolase